MSYIPISKLPLPVEEEATGEVAEIFDDIRREKELPSVGSMYKVMALSPAVLASGWELARNFMQRSTLPPPLLYMIHYAISSARDCQFCSASFKVACRAVGIDEAMLEALIKDLDSVSPRRVKEIINFAVKCALEPLSMTEADYDRVRDQGVSDEELVEIIGWTAIAMYNDTVADAVKLDDSDFRELLGS